MDEYLTVVALNKGSLRTGTEAEALEASSSPSASRGGAGKLKRERAQELLREKMAMTRDMALPWRMGKFIKEV